MLLTSNHVRLFHSCLQQFVCVPPTKTSAFMKLVFTILNHVKDKDYRFLVFTLNCLQNSWIFIKKFDELCMRIVVVSWPATSRVNILSFNYLSVSLFSSSSPSSLLCFITKDPKKSCWNSWPLLLREIVESNISYILSRACTHL